MKKLLKQLATDLEKLSTSSDKLKGIATEMEANATAYLKEEEQYSLLNNSIHIN